MTPASALKKCRDAYTATFEAFAIADPSGQVTNAGDVQQLCAVAYKSALPPLTNWASIRAHNACVSQGMLMGVLSEKEARTLMFIAQTQLSTFHREQKTD
jgi:hypothetical protein